MTTRIYKGDRRLSDFVEVNPGDLLSSCLFSEIEDYEVRMYFMFLGSETFPDNSSVIKLWDLRHARVRLCTNERWDTCRVECRL